MSTNDDDIISVQESESLHIFTPTFSPTSQFHEPPQDLEAVLAQNKTRKSAKVSSESKQIRKDKNTSQLTQRTKSQKNINRGPKNINQKSVCGNFAKSSAEYDYFYDNKANVFLQNLKENAHIFKTKEDM